MLSTYSLTSEQLEIKKLAADFAHREILPVTSLYEKQSLSGSSLLEKICHSGLVNTRIPEAYGGLGLSLLDTCLISEQFAYACSGIACAAQASELALTYLLMAGSHEQKSMFLPMLASDGHLAGVAIGSNIVDKPLMAKEKGKTIILDGCCPLVLNAHLAKWFIIPWQFGYFIVPSEAKGLTVGDKILNMGCQAADAAAIYFDNVSLEASTKLNILPNSIASGDVIHISEQINAAIKAAGSLGIAQAAFAFARKYARERKTFGVPIYQHQIISFMLADIWADIEAGRLMMFQLLKTLDKNGNGSSSALSTQIFALEMAVRAAIDAVQILGGYGYTKDYSVEKLMRDAKTYQSLYGSFSGIKRDEKEQMGKQFLS